MKEIGALQDLQRCESCLRLRGKDVADQWWRMTPLTLLHTFASIRTLQGCYGTTSMGMSTMRLLTVCADIKQLRFEEGDGYGWSQESRSNLLSKLSVTIPILYECISQGILQF